MCLVLFSGSGQIGDITKISMVVLWNWRCRERLTGEEFALQNIRHLKREWLENTDDLHNEIGVV